MTGHGSTDEERGDAMTKRDADHDTHRDRDPSPATLRFVRAVGRRLGRPLPRTERDVLAARLAAVAGDAHATHAASPSGPSWRAILRRRPLVLTGIASVLAVLAVTVGVGLRSTDPLPTIVLASTAPGAPGAAAAGGPAMRDAQGAPEVASDAALPEPMIGMWNPTRYRFVLADGVSVAADPAPAWRLVAPEDLGAAARRLAAALGLPEPAPSEQDASSWSVRTEDGANLWVGANGDWYYGGPYDLWPQWDCPAIEPRVPEDGAEDGADVVTEELEECTPPEPPSDVPSAARAGELVLALVGAVGLDDVRITDVQADEWNAWVTVERELPDGAGPSGLTYGFGFASGEQVASASGTVARIERLGDYPLIGIEDALVRLEGDLNAWLDGWPGDGDGAGQPVPLPAVPDDDAPMRILPLPDESTSSEPMPSEPMPTEPMPEVEEPEIVDRTVRIVDAERVTTMAWTADGTIVLVPHFRLVDEDGGWWFVVAVEDGYVTR